MRLFALSSTVVSRNLMAVSAIASSSVFVECDPGGCVEFSLSLVILVEKLLCSFDRRADTVRWADLIAEQGQTAKSNSNQSN